MMTGPLRSPTLQRWLPVIVLPPVLLLDGLLSAHGRPVDLLSVVFAYLAAVPLLWRAGLAVALMAPLLGGGVLLVVWGFEPPTPVGALAARCLFPLARPPRRP